MIGMGIAVTTTWSEVSGPGTVTFADAAALATKASVAARAASRINSAPSGLIGPAKLTLSAKCLQMGLLPGTTEHLPEKEGLGATGRQTASKRAANPRHSVPPVAASGRWGQVLGTGRPKWTEEFSGRRRAPKASGGRRSPGPRG